MKKTILVSAERGETRVAVLEAKTKGGKRDVAELYIERRGKRSIVGNIYKGKVDNVLPGMEAAFVDIGLERNGFLHVDEIVLPGGEQAPKRGRGSGRRINELIKPGQEILVQVVKDPLKTKGARLSMNVSIAGRYLVFAPQGSGVGVSRRLTHAEPARLPKMVDRTYKGPGGLIVRTAAHGAKKSDFVREIGYLQRLNEVLQRRSETTKAPSLVFQEADLSVRGLRDVFLSEFEKAIIDSEKQFERVTNFFQRTAPELVEGVELYKESKPLLEKWKIDEEIESTLNRRVDLPSGGYLIIDYTEALTVVDVNSGSFTGRGKGGLEETITKVNTEAADEAVRQLRLRDIGGVIVLHLLRQAPGQQPRQGAEGDAQSARRRQVEELRGRGLATGPGRDDPPERHRRRPRDPHRPLSHLPRRGGGALGRDGGAGGAAQDARHRRRARRHRGIPAAGQPEGRGRADRRRQRPAGAGVRNRQAVPLRGRRRAGDRHLHAGREGNAGRDRGAGAAVQGRRGGAGADRRAAHVQRRRRGGPDRLLHRQHHRWWPLRRRAPPGADRGGRAFGGDRLVAGLELPERQWGRR